MLWLGGGSGAGKTTISRAIALRRDLAWYRVDQVDERTLAKYHAHRTANRPITVH